MHEKLRNAIFEKNIEKFNKILRKNDLSYDVIDYDEINLILNS